MTNTPTQTLLQSKPFWPAAQVWSLLIGAVGAGLAYIGGAWGICAVLFSTIAIWCLARSQLSKAVGNPHVNEVSASAVRGSQEGLAVKVAPVWARQVDASTETISEGVGCLLEAFGGMSAGLDQLVQNIETSGGAMASMDLGAAVERCAQPLATLTTASRRAFDERDEMRSALVACVAAHTRIRKLSERTNEVSRHARLVAFNASIEANRERHGQNEGAKTIAQEIRGLAETLNQLGAELMKELSGLEGSLKGVHVRSAAQLAHEDDLHQEIELCARLALLQLLSELGQSGGLSDGLHQACRELRNQLDEAFVHFQVGDRVSQMLKIVSDDMKRFADRMSSERGGLSAQEWLSSLEARYTMEEQRSHHHGNVHVERESNVEFF
jgi:methyl-accepting chemotaxis protein